MPSILVIDDDRDICQVLKKFLGKNNFLVNTAYTGAEGLQQLNKQDYDLIICDYKLPDITGNELLKNIKTVNNQVAIIIITGYADLKTAVEAFRFGAIDYITKPLYPDELLVSITEAIAKSKHAQNNYIEKTDEGGLVRKVKPFNSGTTATFVVGPSEESVDIQRQIELIAPADMSVIISGETGTGKEFVAQSIHKFSTRNSKPFIAIDCGALPKELAGSELFGHLKGAFTGAIADKQGSFEIADGGTIFLDEIGNLSYENQIKLLRVIQERKIKRIGSNKDIYIDVRILAATNENLLDAVKEGKLREDLYHRLNEFKIHIKPLRERRSDIIFFATYFLKKANQALHKQVNVISKEAEVYLSNYHWHGNLRELNNVIRRAVLLTNTDSLEANHLPEEITNQNDTINRLLNNHEDVGLLKSISWSAERQAIVDVLEKVNFNKSKAAMLLNIDRKTLYNKLKLFNITV
ncbi:MAG: sigma-54-dependent transcriptional regulator [Chryseotalea sp.]|jgi:two-component system response regulator HydG